MRSLNLSKRFALMSFALMAGSLLSTNPEQQNWDMDRYRELLRDGTRYLALERAMGHIRLRNKKDDGECVP